MIPGTTRREWVSETGKGSVIQEVPAALSSVLSPAPELQGPGQVGSQLRGAGAGVLTHHLPGRHWLEGSSGETWALPALAAQELGGLWRQVPHRWKPPDQHTLMGVRTIGVVAAAT